jgi:hypothetical protein
MEYLYIQLDQIFRRISFQALSGSPWINASARAVPFLTAHAESVAPSHAALGPKADIAVGLYPLQ